MLFWNSLRVNASRASPMQIRERAAASRRFAQEAARIEGMDRQTLWDWVHRFNECGLDELKDSWCKGNPSRLSRSGDGADPPCRDGSGSDGAWYRALAPG